MNINDVCDGISHNILLMASTTPTTFSSSCSLNQIPCTDEETNSKPRLSKLSNNNLETSDEEQKLYTFYLDVVLNQNVELPKISIYIPLSYTVEQGIELALQQFQRDLVMQCVVIQQEVDDFAPRLAKKSGKCKQDCPMIDKECILSQLSIDTISLQVLNKDSVSIDKSRKRKSSLDEENQYKQIGYRKNVVQQINEEQKPPSTCMYSFC